MAPQTLVGGRDGGDKGVGAQVFFTEGEETSQTLMGGQDLAGKRKKKGRRHFGGEVWTSFPVEERAQPSIPWQEMGILAKVTVLVPL